MEEKEGGNSMSSRFFTTTIGKALLATGVSAAGIGGVVLGSVLVAPTYAEPVVNPTEPTTAFVAQEETTSEAKEEEKEERESFFIPAQTHYHEFTEVIKVSESTCTLQGGEMKMCDCGYQEFYFLPLAAHVPVEQVIYESTDDSEGLIEIRCELCNELLGTSVTPAKVMTTGAVHFEGKGIQNLQESDTVEEQVDSAEEIQEQQTQQESHTHHYEEEEIVAASCRQTGVTLYSCECGDYYVQSTERLGHSFKKKIDVATTEKAGRVYNICVDCGLEEELAFIPKLSAEEVTEKDLPDPEPEVAETTAMPDPEPSESEAETTQASTETSTEEETVAGAESESQESESQTTDNSENVMEHEHSYSEWVVVENATCLKKGILERSCDCGEKETVSIPATDHKYGQWVVVLEATEQAEGKEESVCEVCGDTKEKTTPKISHIHEYQRNEIPATCTEKGKIVIVCTCGDTQEIEVPAKGHSYSLASQTEANCTEESTETYVCDVCGETKENHETPAIGHTLSGWRVIVSATEEAEGRMARVCTICEKEIETKTIDKLIHFHKEGKVLELVEPTCQETGRKIWVCSGCGETITSGLRKISHKYVLSSHKEPTCELSGGDVYACSMCGLTEVRNEVAALGHVEGEWEVIEPATEEKTGTEELSCARCFMILERRTIDKLPHVHKYVVVADNKATCVLDGIHKEQCACGDVKETITPAIGHKAGEWEVTKEPTYTEQGEKHQLCSVCGFELNVEKIPVKECSSHSYTEEKEEPSCTEAGFVIRTCQICGDVQTEAVPALGHIESGEILDVAATCTTDGRYHTECTRCHQEMSSSSVSATGHKEGEWVITTKETCTTNGSREKKCSVCGETLVMESIMSKGHSMTGWQITKEPGCVEGEETNRCGNCSYSETRTVPAIGHQYGDWIIDSEATEETEGSKHKECAVCGDIVTEEIEQLPPHVHDYVISNRQEATCTKNEVITYICECGDSYNETGDKLPHTPSDWEVSNPATETQTGLEVIKCSECGEILETRVIDKIPHVHSFTEEKQDATCEQDGYIKNTCTCGESNTQVIPAKGHQYGDPVITEASCGKEGHSVMTCADCGKTKEMIIPAKEHRYVETEVAEATCGQAGKRISVCSNCGDEIEEVIPAKEHAWETSSVPATCTESGYTIRVCQRCGENEKTDEIAPLGHEESDWIILQEALVGWDGIKEKRCTRCGLSINTESIPMLLTDGIDSVYYVSAKVDGVLKEVPVVDRKSTRLNSSH